MKTNIQKRKLVALPPEAVVLFAKLQGQVEKRIGARVADGQLLRMALLALAKQEGISR